MKKITLLSSIAASALLLSCSSSVNIAKKKYSNGYTVSVSKNVTTNQKQTGKDAAINSTTSVNETAKTIAPEEAATASTATTTTNSEQILATELAETKTLITATYTTPKIAPAKIEKMSVVKKVKTINALKNKMTSMVGGDVNPVVLAILCIFIPPLAVYLKDGLSTKFWIDLILCLLFVLPGVIYAFLVCFDII